MNKLFYLLLYSNFWVLPMKVDINDIRCVTDTSITIRGSRRRMTVPQEVVELLDINDGDKLRWIVFKDGIIHIQKVKNK